MIGTGRTKLYELIAAGEVEAVKLGKSTRITTSSLHDLIKRHSRAACRSGGVLFKHCTIYALPRTSKRTGTGLVSGSSPLNFAINASTSISPARR